MHMRGAYENIIWICVKVTTGIDDQNESNLHVWPLSQRPVYNLNKFDNETDQQRGELISYKEYYFTLCIVLSS